MSQMAIETAGGQRSTAAHPEKLPSQRCSCALTVSRGHRPRAYRIAMFLSRSCLTHGAGLLWVLGCESLRMADRVRMVPRRSRWISTRRPSCRHGHGRHPGRRTGPLSVGQLFSPRPTGSQTLSNSAAGTPGPVFSMWIRATSWPCAVMVAPWPLRRSFGCEAWLTLPDSWARIAGAVGRTAIRALSLMPRVSVSRREN